MKGDKSMNDIIESSTLILTDENGERQVYYKLSEFSIEGKDHTYVIYTDYSETEDRINIYYGKYEGDKVIEVKDKDDIEIILAYIEEIEEQITNDDFSED